MKFSKQIFFTILVLFFLQNSSAQEVKNIEISQEGNQVKVKYDLTGEVNHFDVKLFYSTDEGVTWKGPLKVLKGDVGEKVPPGIGKQITWDLNTEKFEYEGYMVFRIAAFPSIENERSTPPISFGNIPRNSIYAEMSFICYDRIFPMKEKFGLSLAAGVGPLMRDESGWLNFIGSSTLLFGGPNHFFDSGLFVYLSHRVRLYPGFRMGYRFQTKKGYLIKFSPTILNKDVYGTPVFPFFSFGYSF